MQMRVTYREGPPDRDNPAGLGPGGVDSRQHELQLRGGHPSHTLGAHGPVQRNDLGHVGD
jgi:hypothetical protein